MSINGLITVLRVLQAIEVGEGALIGVAPTPSNQLIPDSAVSVILVSNQYLVIYTTLPVNFSNLSVNSTLVISLCR